MVQVSLYLLAAAIVNELSSHHITHINQAIPGRDKFTLYIMDPLANDHCNLAGPLVENYHFHVLTAFCIGNSNGFIFHGKVVYLFLALFIRFNPVYSLNYIYLQDKGAAMAFDNNLSVKSKPGTTLPIMAVVVFLLLLFSLSMVLIISGKSPFNHETLAILNLIIVVAIVVIMHLPVRKLSKDLDDTHNQLLTTTITDDLTHVFNRKHFDVLLRTELSRARRYERDLGCMMLDIDHMEDINKKYGYTFGDEVLQDVAELIKENLRVTDILARYQGNCFICLLPESDSNGVALLAKRLRGLVEGMTYDQTGETIHVTISIGMTSYRPPPKDKTDIRNIIILTENALKKAKSDGGNRIEVST